MGQDLDGSCVSWVDEDRVACARTNLHSAKGKSREMSAQSGSAPNHPQPLTSAGLPSRTSKICQTCDNASAGSHSFSESPSNDGPRRVEEDEDCHWRDGVMVMSACDGIVSCTPTHTDVESFGTHIGFSEPLSCTPATRFPSLHALPTPWPAHLAPDSVLPALRRSADHLVPPLTGEARRRRGNRRTVGFRHRMRESLPGREDSGERYGGTGWCCWKRRLVP
jgi:hypothetical protein